MKYKILCSIPDAHVLIDDSNPEKVVINVSSRKMVALSNCKAGDFVAIGGRKYLVVDTYVNGNPLLITASPVTRMKFGRDRNYINSDIKEFCETRFVEEYVKNVSDYCTVITDLQADDGTYFKDFDGEEYINYVGIASIPSTSFYRKYRKILSKIDLSGAATVTAVSAETNKCDSICQICSDGILSWSLTTNILRVFCVVSPSPLTKVHLL